MSGREGCPCPTLEIVDRRTGNVVSGTTITKIVGQKVKLQVRCTPAAALSNIRWTIPGQTVKSYTQTTAAGTKTDLTAADLQVANADFYWIGGGNQTVQVSATAQGCALTASVTVNVLRPTMNRFTTTTSSVNVTTSHFASPGNPVLGAYQPTPAPARYGCQWDAQVTAPVGGAGQIGFTQKILVNRSWTNNAGVVRRFTSGGVLVLDDGLGIQYSGPQPVAAGASATLSGASYSDSPWIPLSVTDQSASASERFQLYLIYRPAGGDSIWVTLGKAPWSWGGATTRVGAPAGAANNWNPPTGGAMTPPGTSNGTDSTELPTWNGNFHTSTWS